MCFAPFGRWFIYTLHDPREPDVVRYVGWTIDPKKRLASHIRAARNLRDKTHCGEWKHSLLEVGVEPVLVVIGRGSGVGWEEAERRWIRYYRDVSEAELTNISAGGGGALGCRWTLSGEVRAARREAGILRGFSEYARTRAVENAESRRGVPLTPEHRAKISAAHQGKKKPPEVVEKTASFWRGRSHSESTKAKLRASHEGLDPLRRPAAKKPASPERKAKISAALKTHYARNGPRKTSDETRAKISAALKAYRARKCSVSTSPDDV